MIEIIRIIDVIEFITEFKNNMNLKINISIYININISR